MKILRVYAGTGRSEDFSPETVLETLAREFGGATLTLSQGSWIGQAGKIEIEPGVVIDLAIPSERRNEALDILRRLFPHEKAFGVEWRGEFFVLYRGERLE